MDREQRAVTQEEVWALRRQASGEERHGTEGEKRDQRSGVAGVGKDEMGILGSRRLEGAPREERADLARGLGVPPPPPSHFPAAGAHLGERRPAGSRRSSTPGTQLVSSVQSACSPQLQPVEKREKSQVSRRLGR